MTTPTTATPSIFAQTTNYITDRLLDELFDKRLDIHWSYALGGGYEIDIDNSTTSNRAEIARRALSDYPSRPYQYGSTACTRYKIVPSDVDTLHKKINAAITAQDTTSYTLTLGSSSLARASSRDDILHTPALIEQPQQAQSFPPSYNSEQILNKLVGENSGLSWATANNTTDNYRIHIEHRYGSKHASNVYEYLLQNSIDSEKGPGYTNFFITADHIQNLAQNFKISAGNLQATPSRYPATTSLQELTSSLAAPLALATISGARNVSLQKLPDGEYWIATPQSQAILTPAANPEQSVQNLLIQFATSYGATPPEFSDVFNKINIIVPREARAFWEQAFAKLKSKDLIRVFHKLDKSTWTLEAASYSQCRDHLNVYISLKTAFEEQLKKLNTQDTAATVFYQHDGLQIFLNAKSGDFPILEKLKGQGITSYSQSFTFEEGRDTYHITIGKNQLEAFTKLFDKSDILREGLQIACSL